MVLILFFIVVLNVVSIALTYYCLSNIEKKEKIIFIAVGISIMYILTSFIYWISTRGIEIKEVSEIGKNLITFMFVPINGIIALPMMAKSYDKYTMGKLAPDKFRNRVIVLAVILLSILIVECSYFKNIQNNVVALIEDNNQQNQQTIQNSTGEVEIIDDNTSFEDVNNIETNQISNDAGVENTNIVSNNIENEVDVIY